MLAPDSSGGFVQRRLRLSDCGRWLQSRWQNAHERVGLAVDADDLPDGTAIATEAPSPKTVVNNDHFRTSWPVVLGFEESPNLCVDSQHREKIATGSHPEHSFRSSL